MSQITESEVPYGTKEMPAIYMITNTVNGKKYIGQTVNFSKRISRHKRSANGQDSYNRPIVAAFKKYGIENFEFSIIERPPIAMLTEREQYWMDFYNTHVGSGGYNASPSAGSTFGLKHSDETKRKVSIASRGRKHTEASKAKLSAAHSGKVISEVSRIKNRLAHLGKKVPNKQGKRGVFINQICRVTGSIIGTFRSAAAAHKAVGGGASPILAVCKGKRKSAGGYFWEFVCQP